VQLRGMEKGRRFKFEGEDSAFLPSSIKIHHSEGTGTSTADKIDAIGLLLKKKKESNESRKRKSNAKIKSCEIESFEPLSHCKGPTHSEKGFCVTKPSRNIYFFSLPSKLVQV